MEKNAETITINGEEYIRKSTANAMKLCDNEGLPYCIVRTYSAGVFAGYLKDRNGKDGTIINARRLWYWDGAASLSELAMKGVSKPKNCKFPCEVPTVFVTEIIEVIPATEAARKSIAEVPEWSAR